MLLPADEQFVAPFFADGNNTYDLVIHINPIKHAKVIHPQFPFRQGVRAELLAVPRLLVGLVLQVDFDGGDDSLLVILAKVTHVTEGAGRERDLKPGEHPATSPFVLAPALLF
jgi:hypothetical protein